MKFMYFLKVAVASFALVLVLIGCASTNFSSSTTPVTISEEFIRQGAATWRGTRILGINNNYLKTPTMDSTYTVDPGLIKILVSYRENKGEFTMPPKFFDTEPFVMNAILKPNEKYQLKASSNSKFVVFTILEISSNKIIATSNEVPIIYKSSDLPLESLIKK